KRRHPSALQISHPCNSGCEHRPCDLYPPQAKDSMKYSILFLLLLYHGSAYALTPLTFEEPVKQRVFVLTDITNEPDDQQSLVRFLVSANEYDVEGIVATTSTHLRNRTRQDKIRELVGNYGKV